jgi:3-methyladenine DNA glycosylase AlkD
MKQLLSDIHAQFRRQMNADIAGTLARGGVRYHLCFGVPSMRLREVAERYTPSVELAEALWTEDIRESKMLATRLYPLGQMTREVADRWAGEIRYAEIADQACMNLFSRLPYAEALAAEWLQTDAKAEGMRCYCALMIYARREEFRPDTERLRALAEDATLPLTLRTAAHQLLPLDEEDHEQ